jgi:hypothetical protein
MMTSPNSSATTTDVTPSVLTRMSGQG